MLLPLLLEELVPSPQGIPPMRKEESKCLLSRCWRGMVMTSADFQAALMAGVGSSWPMPTAVPAGTV